MLYLGSFEVFLCSFPPYPVLFLKNKIQCDMDNTKNIIFVI